MRNSLFASLVAAAFVVTTPLSVTAQEKLLNLYSSRHYQTDEALYANFTRATGVRINRIEAGEDPLIERLRNEGANLFSSPVQAQPAGNTSSIVSGALERSNVSPVLEMSRLMEVNRNYTSVAGMISRIDELRRTAISRLADNA